MIFWCFTCTFIAGGMILLIWGLCVCKVQKPRDKFFGWFFLTYIYWYLKFKFKSDVWNSNTPNTTRKKSTKAKPRFPGTNRGFLPFEARFSAEGVLGCTLISHGWEEIHPFVFFLFFIVSIDGQRLSVQRLRCAKIVTTWKGRKVPSLEFDVVSSIN